MLFEIYWFILFWLGIICSSIIFVIPFFCFLFVIDSFWDIILSSFSNNWSITLFLFNIVLFIICLFLSLLSSPFISIISSISSRSLFGSFSSNFCINLFPFLIIFLVLFGSIISSIIISSGSSNFFISINWFITGSYLCIVVNVLTKIKILLICSSIKLLINVISYSFLL